MIRVVKLGGSLLETAALPLCLAAAMRLPGLTVIVPGGGPFADQVRTAQRRYRFGEVAAHRMALLAMQQMAELMRGLCPELEIVSGAEAVAAAAIFAKTLVWVPQIAELDAAAIPASWDITSDSLAAWLAGRIAADTLVVVKSAPITAGTAWPELQRQGILDPAFARFANAASFKITVVNKDEFLFRHD
ncbi:amino acid kinase family protein [Methylomonas koyamae]|uniref:amino acid kinase family protein n=1 Tax=Methylomonas koyamae TaxID=702114 RepID=UPI002872C926|nr:uridylate kinase [Methylomonas koyamae]WNB74251.1 uridylate kinase [Methylomonas koyamae]